MSSSEHTVTWRELLLEATQAFRTAAIEEPAMDARRLVEQASGAAPSDLVLLLDDSVTERSMNYFEQMVQRRCAGEPLQYVLGSWAFRSLDLMVDSRVLIPRPETEVVVEVALAELDLLGARDRSCQVVDLGTGSGAIGLSIAMERVRTQVLLTDRSSDALNVATANIAGLGRAGARVSTQLGSWFDALPLNLRGQVDMLISNPPYVPTDELLPDVVADWEPAEALRSGQDGTKDLRVLILGAGEWLQKEGVLVCELSPEQAPTIHALAGTVFSHARIESDLTGRDRMLVAQGPL
ncbi:MAG: peptide chain release factor N(5)-glutamine methyltransferase [Microthrixaceae bacterium]